MLSELLQFGVICLNIFWYAVYFYSGINKKVLLRKRKRHTARRVASARSMLCCPGYPLYHPDLVGGGVPGVPPPSKPGSVTHLPSQECGSPPPTIHTWLGYIPTIQTWPGYPPPPPQEWGTPHHPDLARVPRHPDMGWGTPHPERGWGTPHPHKC